MWLDHSSTGTLLAVLSVATLVESGYPNPRNGDHFQCREEGFHADPYDPMVFYRCVDFGNGSPLVKYRFTCGPGTVFSKADGDVCVHAPSCGQKGCGGTNDGSDKINDIDTDNKPGTGKEKPGVQGKPESRPPSSSSSPPPPPSPTCPHCPSKVPGSAGTTVAVTPSSVTASQTTAQVPTKTPVIGTQCKCAGFMADPNNCYKFYQCVDDGNGSFRRYEFTCGPGTIWDPKIDTCNHPWAANRAGCPGATANNPPKPASPSGSSHETTTGATTSSPSAGATISSPSAGASPSSPSAGATPSSPSAGATPSSPSAGATPSSVGPPEETASTVESVTSSESHTHPSSQPGNGPPCTCEGFMENPKDCTKYYRCVNDETGTYERYEFSCAEGAFWDQNSGTCIYPPDGKLPAGCKASTGSTSPSSPASQPEETTVTEPTKPSTGGPQCTFDGFMEDPEDCTKFYRCVENGMGSYTRYEFTCAAGTVWDPIAVTCNHPWAANRVGCKDPTDSTPQSSPASEPEEPTQTPNPSAGGPQCTCEGFMEDPQDCKKFYRCMSVGTNSYQRYEFECGPDTVWDQNVLTCNHPWQANRPECAETPTPRPSHGTPKPSEPTVTAGSPGTEPTQAPPGHGSSVAPPSGGSSAVPPSGGSSVAPPSGGSSAVPPSGGSSVAPPSGESAAPPSGESSPAPPSSGSSAAPPSGESSAAPTPEGSSGAPPSGGSSSPPPAEESSTIPPCDGSTHVPPSDSSSAAPPSGSSSVAPPSGGSSGAPPSDGSSAVPPSDGSSGVPPSDGSSAVPPSDGSSGVPPSDGSSAVPPSGSSSGAPPTGSSSEAPPSGSSSGAPPSGSASVAPPSSGSSTVTPCDGSNEVGGDPGSGKEPACGEQPNEHCSVCKEEGFFPNEEDCTKFYRCVSTGHGTYWKYEFSCGPGTAWDQSLLTCNHRSQVASCNSGGSTGVSSTEKPAKITTASGSSSESTSSDGSSGVPPSDGSSAVPPSDGSSGVPPSDGSSAVPPSDGSSGVPPSDGSSAVPPSDGSSGVPPSDGSSAVPPSDGSSGVPPSDGSSAVPPSGGSSGAPPSGSSSGAPPSGSSSGAPPSGSSSGAPPSGSSSVTPPSSGSSTVTPCDGSNEVGGDSGSGKEPACGEQSNEHCSVCKEEGFFPNEEDCTKFYRCVSTGHGTYWKYEFSCGPGTAWDQSLLTCNHRSQVASCNNGGSTGVSSTEKPAKITTASSSSSESTSSSSSSSSESTTESSSESGTSETSANSTPDFGSTASSEVTTGESAATSTDASQATTVTEEQSTVTDSASTEVENVPTSTDHPDESQSTTSQGEEGTTSDSGEPSTSGSHETTTEVEQSSTETSAPSTSTEGCNEPPPSATVPCPIGNLTGDQIVLVCPTGFKRHPKYCNIFYQCTSDSPMEVKIVTFGCPDDTIFDEKKIQCLPENEGSQPCDGMKAGARVYRRVDRSPMSMVYVDQREPLCPAEGYQPYNKEECSSFFYKCKNDSSEKLRGYMYECPEGFVFSQVSRRCERLSSLPACTDNYDFGENNASPTRSKLQLPTEISNVSPRKLANY